MFDNDAGLLYVTGDKSDSVHIYDSSTGAFVDSVSTAGSGLENPYAVIFDAQGRLLVSSVDSDKIVRFTRSSGMVFDASLSSVWPDPITVQYDSSDGKTPEE